MGSLWNRSGIVERYADDLRAAGAKAYFFEGGTTTPLTVYQDSGEAAAHPHPVVADANGRWPDVFVPYTLSYDVQVKTADDVQLTYSLEIANPDPVELTVTPSPSGNIETGMIHAEVVNSPKTGYVRLNGRTIGNSTSGATERSNEDCVNLFIYLWNNLSNTIAPVSGGRGSSAINDFTSNKTIILPDARGAALIGLDNMGASAGSFFTGLTFALGDATTAGSSLGTNALTLAIANLPAHAHTGTTNTEGAHTHTGTTGNENQNHTHFGTTDPENQDHTHSINITSQGQSNTHTHTYNTFSGALQTAAGANPPGGTAAGTTTGAASADHTHLVSGNSGGVNSTHTHGFLTGNQNQNHTHGFTTNAGSAHSHTFTTDSVGTGTAINNLPKSLLVTWYIKL